MFFSLSLFYLCRAVPKVFAALFWEVQRGSRKGRGKAGAVGAEARPRAWAWLARAGTGRHGDVCGWTVREMHAKGISLVPHFCGGLIGA